MKRFQKLATMLLAVTMIVALFGVIHVFGAVEQISSQAETGEAEQEGDIDIPIYPQKVLQSIFVDSLPNKLSYRKGEALNKTGLVVKAHYNDGTSAIVKNYKTSGFNSNVLGDQTITVSLNGKTATFTVNVYMMGDVNGDGEITSVDAAKILQHIADWNVTIHLLAADVDNNGQITDDDATKILQYVAGWNVTLG